MIEVTHPDGNQCLKQDSRLLYCTTYILTTSEVSEMDRNTISSSLNHIQEPMMVVTHPD